MRSHNKKPLYFTDGAYTSDEPSRFTVVAGTNYHSKIKQRIAVRTFKNHPDYKVSTHNRSDSFFVYVANDLGKHVHLLFFFRPPYYSSVHMKKENILVKNVTASQMYYLVRSFIKIL